MAQLAFGAGGALIGHQFGPGGAGLGFLAGSLVYSFLNPPDDIIQEGTRLNNQITTTSAYGLMRPIKYGTIPINGNIIDGSDRYESVHRDKTDSSGKGGLSGGQDVVTITYTYSIDLAVGLGEPIDEILQIYANERLIYDASPNSTITSPSWLKLRIYKGDEDQLPDPTLQVLHGADTPAYRGEAYVVFTRFELQEFNNQIPSFRFNVISKSSIPTIQEEKIFGQSGDDIGALLYDKRSDLIFYASQGQEPNVIGLIYDSITENSITTLRWPVATHDFTVYGGGGLYSIPSYSSGVFLPAGPNAHFFINMKDINGNIILANYDAKSGAYVGSFDLGTNHRDTSSQCIVPDENRGIFYRIHFDQNGWFSFLEGFRVWFDLTGQITLQSIGEVQKPVANREGANEWDWKDASYYPEGSTGFGKFMVNGVDRVSSIDYLCIIDISQGLFVDVLIQATGYTFNNITAISWDSVQQYFWVMGESDTISRTRLKAYDLSGNEKFSVEWDNDFYSEAQEYFHYDESNFVIWMYASNAIYQFHTVNHDLTLVEGGYTGTSGGAGNSLIYINATQTAWRKVGDGKIDLYRLNRLQDEQITLDEVVEDLCNRATLNPSQYDVTNLATKVVEGYKIEKNEDIRSSLIPLQQAYLFDGIDKGNLIEFRFRGDPAVDTILETDLGASDGVKVGGDYIKIDREMDLNLPKKTEITYYNKNAEFEQNVQRAKRIASDIQDNSSRLTLPLVLTDDEAIRLADVLVHLPYIEREIYKFTTLPKWQYLVSGDVIDINYNRNTLKGRIIQKDFENGLVKLICSREDSSVLQSFLNGGSVPDRTVEIIYNSLTQSIHLDIPLLLETNDNAGYYLSACGADDNWTGGNIYKSPDGNTFNYIKTVITPSTFGTADQALGSVIDHDLWDRTSTIKVYMKHGQLESITEEQALKGENAVAIGRGNRWEIINFVNATLVGTNPNVYNVDTFLRGRLGSEWTIGTHQLGEYFCMLSTDDLSYINDSLANLNIQYLYRAVSLGGSVYSDRIIDQFHTNTGVCLKPYAPGLFEYEKNPTTLDIKFKWNERTRYKWNNYWSGIPSNAPNYQIDIPLPDLSTKEITGITTNQYIYTRTEQITDGFNPDDLEVKDCTIYHISDAIGKGYPSITSVGFGPPPHPMFTYAGTIGMVIGWECNQSSGTVLNDTFGNYNMNLFGSTYTLGQPAILPGYSKGCLELDNTGESRSTIIPADQPFDQNNYSIGFVFEPLENSSLNQRLLTVTGFFDPGYTDFMWINWKSDGSITASFQGNETNSAGVYNFGSKVLIILSHYKFDDVSPNRINLYVNNFNPGQRNFTTFLEDRQKIITAGHAALSSADPVNQHKISHVMVFDHELNQTEIKNLYILSGL